MKHKMVLEGKGARDIVEILEELEAKTGKKLYARFKGDNVDGHITIFGSECEVVLYDDATAPAREELESCIREKGWLKNASLV